MTLYLLCYHIFQYWVLICFFFTGDLLQGQLERERREPNFEAVAASAAAGQEPQVAHKRLQAQAEHLVRKNQQKSNLKSRKVVSQKSSKYCSIDDHKWNWFTHLI